MLGQLDDYIKLSRRLKYKIIKDNYCHFIFDCYRFEYLQDNEGPLLCICKVGPPKQSNTNYSFKNIISIHTNEESVIWNNDEYNKANSVVDEYIKAHKL